jgi:hypothetical protein
MAVIFVRKAQALPGKEAEAIKFGTEIAKMVAACGRPGSIPHSTAVFRMLLPASKQSRVRFSMSIDIPGFPSRLPAALAGYQM